VGTTCCVSMGCICCHRPYRPSASGLPLRLGTTRFCFSTKILSRKTPFTRAAPRPRASTPHLAVNEVVQLVVAAVLRRLRLGREVRGAVHPIVEVAHLRRRGGVRVHARAWVVRSVHVRATVRVDACFCMWVSVYGVYSSLEKVRETKECWLGH
jgi:hypothetical protein